MAYSEMTTMSEPQVFTLEAVNAMIPRISEVVGDQLGRRSAIEKKLFALAELLGEVPDEITPIDGDSSKVRELKLDLIDCIAAYQDGWRDVEAFGAIVKDTRIGLLDFYGRVEGKLVWLCWKYGETECAHYHALDEGFAARRGIGASVRQRLLN